VIKSLLVVDREGRRLLLLERRQPLYSLPAFFSRTRLPTTSETGSRARISSRNWGVKRMGGVSGAKLRAID